MKQDFMWRALELAKKRVGFVSPNPAVGAVIVKGDKIVAEGYHKKAGDDHAEVVAIKNMMKSSGIVTVDVDQRLFKNAVLYVTLEPCSHYGKTGPCANAIVEAGFGKVCVGLKDPFRKVNGSGIKYLKDAGIEVEMCDAKGDLAKEIRALNQPFIKWAQTGFPYVTLKAGVSLDGKIATSSGESKWITSEIARKESRLERSRHDAVLVGTGTVNADNSELAAHGKYRHKKLLRIVIDAKLELNLKKKIFRDENVFVACTAAASKKNQKKYTDAGIEFKILGKKSVNIQKLLKLLGSIGIQSVLVEGGSSIHGSFVDAALKDSQLVDRILFYVAPKIFGGASLSVIGGIGVKKLSKSLQLKNLTSTQLGEDILLSADVNFY